MRLLLKPKKWKMKMNVFINDLENVERKPVFISIDSEKEFNNYTNMRFAIEFFKQHNINIWNEGCVKLGITKIKNNKRSYEEFLFYLNVKDLTE